MTEQYLDDADVGLLLEQMRGEAMAQGVHADALVDAGAPCGFVYGAVELPHGEGRAGNLAGEQPCPRPLDQPPAPQQVEQWLRQHHVTVLVALALIDPDQHAGAVDIADLERDDFGGAQSGAVGDAQRGLVLDVRGRCQQPGHFLGTQHDRQPPRLAGEHDVFDHLTSPQRDFEEEAQGRHGGIHAGNAEAAGCEVQLITADVLDARPVGRMTEECGEVLDGTDVASLSLGPELADGHVVDHPLAQRAYGLVGHGGLLSWVRL